VALARITILISGRGSNMAALIDAANAGTIDGAVTHVISNRPDAAGLAYAQRNGIATSVVDHRAFASRAEFEAALAQAIDASEPDLVVLAGFMRILGSEFVRRYAGRMLNIHPSLLPLFPGLGTHQQAIDAGEAEHGATVHFVTAELDHGPVVAQARVPVLPGDTEATLSARVLVEEHKLYPLAVRLFVQDMLSIHNGEVRINEAPADSQAFSSI
jgi:phosphoribosylglycinamide formyltransferase-1